MGSPLIALLLGSLGGTLPASGPASASALAGAPCVVSRSAYGPRFVLPLELAQGATVGRGSPAPYAASIRLHPTYVLDRTRQIRIAATLGPALTNPDVELLLGGRITKSVFELNAGPVRGIGAHLGLEALYGTSGRALLGAVLIADGGGLFQATVRVEPDVTNGATLLELGLGMQLYEDSVPYHPAAGPTRPVESGYASRVREQMTNDTRAIIGTLRNEDPDACERFLRSARAFVRHPDPRITTIAAFRQALRANGLARLDEDMDPPEPPPPGARESDAVDALYLGLTDGLSTPAER